VGSPFRDAAELIASAVIARLLRGEAIAGDVIAVRRCGAMFAAVVIAFVRAGVGNSAVGCE